MKIEQIQKIFSGQELKKFDASHHFHSQTNARMLEKDGPLLLVEGDGVFVKDCDGKSYLEAMSGLWYANLGFSDSRLIQAAKNQFGILPCYHTFNSRSNDVCSRFAAKLSTKVPLENAKIFFVNSGSDAIDTMIKFSWYYHAAKGNSSRRKIITRSGAFHGSSVFGAILSGLPHMHAGFNLPYSDLILKASCPDLYKGIREGESEEEYGDRLIAEIIKIIAENGAENIAAMIAEPIIGAGGVYMPPKNYFNQLSSILKEHGILLLMDEVICGFGRTGNWFGSQSFGALPDIISMAKGLTAGYVPMGAVGISGDVYEILAEESSRLGTFGHGFTYSGHPVASAVGLEALRIYEEMDAPRHVSKLGEKLHEHLMPFEESPIVGNVRTGGFIAGIELMSDKKTRTTFPKSVNAGKIFENNALKEGLIIRSMGDTIAICPPFILSDHEFEMLIEKLRRTLEKTEYVLK